MTAPLALWLLLASVPPGQAVAPAISSGGAEPPGLAAPSGLYRGTIAGEAVSVCFGSADGSRSVATSAYYNEAIGKTVALTALGVDRPADWMESEPSSFRRAEEFDPEAEAWWTLTASTPRELRAIRHVPAATSPRPGDLSGTFPGGEGASSSPGAPLQPVTLTRLSEDCAGYEAHRLALPRRPRDTQAVAAVAVDITAHPLTQIVAATAVRGLPPGAAARISRELADAARTLDRDWFDCRAFEGGIEARFLSPRLVVFSVWTASYCGGAHPEEERRPLAFDGRTGDRFELSGWLAPESWPMDAPDGKLRALLRRAMVAAEGDEICAAHRDQVGWSDIAPWLGADGIHFEVSESDRAFLQCENDYLLSFAAVRPFLTAAHRTEFDALAAEARRLAALQPAGRPAD